MTLGLALLGVKRFGRTRVLVAGGLTACAGMLLASLAPVTWLALAGFAATGLGLANLCYCRKLLVIMS